MNALLERLGRLLVRRHWVVIGAWVVILVALGILRSAFGGTYVNDYTVPGSESAQGLDVSGSGTLVRALIADGLVDELHLFVYPVTRSAGPRLFGESLPPAKWNRADAELYGNGVTYLKLTPAP